MRIIIPIIIVLLIIELLLGYQTIANLFYKNEKIYMTTIPFTNTNLNFEYFMLALAGLGLLQSLILIGYLMFNFHSLTNRMVTGMIFFLIFSLIGINSYIIYYYTDIIKGGATNDVIQNKLLNELQIKILIPSSVGIFVILSALPIFI
jgi:hypothetical protein